MQLHEVIVVHHGDWVRLKILEGCLDEQESQFYTPTEVRFILDNWNELRGSFAIGYKLAPGYKLIRRERQFLKEQQNAGMGRFMEGNGCLQHLG